MQRGDLPNCFPNSPSLIQYTEPVTSVEQTSVDTTEVGIVISEEHGDGSDGRVSSVSDRHGHDSTCNGRRASTRVPPCGSPDTLKVPPIASTRSLMPVKPAPGA